MFWGVFLHGTLQNSVPLVWLKKPLKKKKKNPSIHIKQPIHTISSNNPNIHLKKKQTNIHNISQIPTQNILNKFTIFLKSIVGQSIVSILGIEHQINSHT